MTWLKTAETQPEPLLDVLIAHVCEIDDEPIVEMAYLSKSGLWQLSDATTITIAPPPYWQPMPALPAELQCAQQPDEQAAA